MLPGWVLSDIDSDDDEHEEKIQAAVDSHRAKQHVNKLRRAWHVERVTS